MKTIFKLKSMLVAALALFMTTISVQAQGFERLTNDQFDQFNPLKVAGTPTDHDLTTPGGIISRVLFFAFPIAGLILFVMIFWGGFDILSGAASKKSMDAGRQRITAAVIGFLLLFISFWLVRLIEMVFGVKIF